MSFYQRHNAWALPLFAVLAIVIIYKTPPLFSKLQSDLPTSSFPSRPVTLTTRFPRNLIYWTPHKTGSTSMRLWLGQVGKTSRLKVKEFAHYPYSKPTTWNERAGTRKCSILMGHIRTIQNREHEGSLGAVVTTSRNPMHTFASKYFHRTAQGKDDVPFLSDASSPQSRYWFFYFNDIDACEQLRYYDGKEGCVMEKLRERARKIAQRIDCVVDTDDPEDDLAAICRMMKLQECPALPRANIKNYMMYGDLFQNKHLVEAMQRVVDVGNVLREELLKRRCRFLVEGDELSKPGIPLPQWPHKGCRDVANL